MERKTHIITRARIYFLATFLLFSSPGNSQPAEKGEDFGCRISVYLQNGNMKAWANLLPEMEKSWQRKNDLRLLMELTRAQYGYLAYSAGKDMDDEAKAQAEQVLEAALANVETLLPIYKPSGEVLALKSALTAFRIAFNPLMAPILGPQSMSILDQAYRKDPKNPYVLLEKANGKNYAPAFVGGNPAEAVGLYLKAIAGFEKDKKSFCNWVYLVSMVNLGQCFKRQKRYSDEITVYEKILGITPDFQWVKNELLPEARKNQKLSTTRG